MMLASVGCACAQTSTTQNVDANLIDVVDLTFTGSGSGTGNTVTMQYTSADNYANGVNSANQQISIVSTKAFNVVVRSSSANFTYTGTSTLNTTMPVSNALKLKVAANNTQGTTASTFSSFAALTNSNQNLITNGSSGTNKTFDIQYRGTPSFNYPGGLYSINIIYTVTQI